MRHLSLSGAAIDLAERASLPPSFRLPIESDKITRRCRPVSSNERRIGIAFD